MPDAVLDVVAEDVEVEHVAEEVHPSAVEKHAGQERAQRLDTIEVHPTRHEPVRADQRLAGVLTEANLVHEHEDVRRDQQPGDDRRGV